MEFKRDVPFTEYKDAFYKKQKQLYETPPWALDQGMCRCSDCGRLTTIDYKFCKHCDQQILIIHEKGNTNAI